ncbi:MAG: mechanosensitive ion channel family protein [Candidatus Sumerlaeia bacterium]|nr:mechanosensitive ion channel family protein [Candidatus Sumerlaeia bacterium]
MMEPVAVFFQSAIFIQVAYSLLALIIGVVALRAVARFMEFNFKDRLTPQQFMIISKAVFWMGWLVIILTVVNNLGLKISTVLGAAGILGVAIGFAAQTSASNLISGIFLIFERPFKVGDIIQVGDTTGAVVSVDLLSVKIRKFDNCYVRIPNEMIIKTQVSNITNFPLRRVDINVGIAYKEDLERVRKVLLEVAEEFPKALTDPPPVVVFTGFGDSSQNILFGVWAMKTDFLDVRNGLTYGIKKAFDRNGIEIPFPHLSIYTGEVTKPFPVEMGPRVGGDNGVSGGSNPS